METSADTFIKLACVGGIDSGNVWDYFHSKIDQILIWYSSDVICCLQFLRRDLDCKTKLSPKYGGVGTSATNFEAILVGGSVLEISGSFYGYCIRTLRIVTSSGTYGPYGTAKALYTPFSFKTPIGIVGFHGFYRPDYLSAIGVYIDTGSGSKVKKESF
ncbi:jacalin-related lectin 3-like [Iris pallida]|uniref:Jacalin-related lectin 3-like n=1 Tax=Iris pallida TaxID=29817 RepID=A0AAX6I0U5_IRIPA|nr:jacalin-related lectin 3-like [Iris pallida]